MFGADCGRFQQKKCPHVLAEPRLGPSQVLLLLLLVCNLTEKGRLVLLPSASFACSFVKALLELSMARRCANIVHVLSEIFLGQLVQFICEHVVMPSYLESQAC